MKMRGKIKRTIGLLGMVTAFIVLLAISGYAEEAPAEEAASDPGTELSLALASLTLDPEPVTIDCDQSVLLAALVSNGGEAVWSSSDEKVAVVNENGDGSVTVIGVGGGSATIRLLSRKKPLIASGCVPNGWNSSLMPSSWHKGTGSVTPNRRFSAWTDAQISA